MNYQGYTKGGVEMMLGYQYKTHRINDKPFHYARGVPVYHAICGVVIVGRAPVMRERVNQENPTCKTCKRLKQ